MGGVRFAHLVHASPGRSFSNDGDELSQRWLRARRLELHAPVGTVANPSGYPSATRGLAYEPPEANALHAPMNLEAQPHVLSARALEQRRQHRRQKRFITCRAGCTGNEEVTGANSGGNTLQRRRDVLTGRWCFGAWQCPRLQLL